MPRVVWSRSAGRRAASGRPTSRVRVFERADIPGRLFLTRYWIGRDEALALPEGITRESAELLARETALKRERAILRGRDVFGEERERPTLADMLHTYHTSARADSWSPRHRADWERYRRFWLEQLGEERPADAVTLAEVERIAWETGRRRGWAPATSAMYLRYMRAAYRFGHLKARTLPQNPLLGIEMPAARVDTSDRVYTPEEGRRLMEPHPEVDWRVTVAFTIAVLTGRRLSSIRHLWVGRHGSETTSDVARLPVRLPDPGSGTIRERDRLFLHFRKEYDKGRRGRWVAVPAGGEGPILEALDRPQVAESGWLLPEGRMEYDDPRDKPVGDSALIRMLHAAEDALGIARVPGRGFHGAKRLHVTLGFEAAGGDPTIVGDVTGNLSRELLVNTYRQQDLVRIVRQVDGVWEALQRER